MKKEVKKHPTVQEVASFLMLEPMIQSLMDEVKEFSKKKPDGPLNKLKVEMINKRLKPMKELLSILPLANFLDELNDEALPTNSDTVLILGQYVGAIKSFREAFHGYHVGDVGWWTDLGFKSNDSFKSS